MLSGLTAQEKDSILSTPDGYFAEKIAAYEGTFAPLFRATDINGNDYFLDKYEGHIVILHFWQVYSPSTTSQIPALNRVVKEYFDQGVVVFGFADEDEQELNDFVTKNEVNYPLIPNSRDFARVHFGGELGYPRTFIIDKYGIIQKVTIGGKVDDEIELYHKIKPVIEEHLKY